jgi:hypothetical protein
MAQSEVALSGMRADPRAVARDLASLLGFSAALAVTAGVIRTPMHLPGHSALFWLPVLVLAGAHRRPGMALGAALFGGGVAGLWGGVDGLGFASLLGAAAVMEVSGLGRPSQPRAVRWALAGMGAHAAKFALKLIASLTTGLPLNLAGLFPLATLGLYVAFGLAAGLLAWALLKAWRGVSGPWAEVGC